MGFDLNEISSNLHNRNYRYIGSGSGRHVFDLENGYVVKAARNRKGIAQNMVECKIASEDHSPLFAEIVQASDGFDLLIMEKAERIGSMTEVWKYFGVSSNSELSRMSELRKICERHGLVIQDLCRSSSWGKINGRYVIIDYGFTRSVRRKYYSGI
jgi:hypothetical protein